MNLLLLAWKNLTHKPLNTLLSLLLFALGAGLISFLMQVNRQLEEKFSRNLAGIDLVIGAKGSPLQLILCSMYHIDAPTGNILLQEARPFMNPKHPLIARAVPLSLGDNAGGFRIVGTVPEFLDLYGARLANGKLWSSPGEVVLGAEAARRLGLDLGSSFRSSHGLILDDSLDLSHELELSVSGILARSGTVADQLILCSTETIWQLHEHQPTVGAVADEHDDYAHADHTDSLPANDASREITSLLVKFRGKNFQTLNMARNVNENTNLQAASPALEMNRLSENIGAGEAALRFLGLLIMVVSGLSIFISLYSSLKSRKYELALLRVMGASAWRLFFLILAEGLLLALIGYLAGMALSHGGIWLLSGQLEQAYRYGFDALRLMPEELYLLAGVLLLGTLAAVIPANQARRTQIHNTLTEG
jgi:putative ABC transport system permease protein